MKNEASSKNDDTARAYNSLTLSNTKTGNGLVVLFIQILVLAVWPNPE